MTRCEIAAEAIEDLEGIFDYTIDRWGIEQAYRYRDKIKQGFAAIASAPHKGKAVARNRSDIRVLRVEHHYVFYRLEAGKNPLILAVFHERMNLMTRLRKRLST